MTAQNFYPRSRVELHDFAANYYDWILNAASLGSYAFFIRKAIAQMKIAPDDKILDLGAGTGRNALLMRKYLSEKGKIVGLDVSQDMIRQFEKKTESYSNITIQEQRIDLPFRLEDSFDKVFISFVLHGFPQEIRLQIIENAFQSLNEGGSFFILDYNEFNYNKMPFLIKYPFRFIECPYAFDFIEKDWQQILRKKRFHDFREKFFFLKYVRLLKAKKI